MSFLAPFFLLGGLAIVGPIIFHLIRRTTKTVVPFSSLMFLSPSPPRVTRRSRPENLWLLLLRILVLLLLAISFGRPLLQRMTASELTGTAGRRTVILLDTSASMRRADLWPRAQAKVREVAARLREQDGVSLVLFDRESHTVIPFEQWAQAPAATRLDLVNATLAALQPSWLPTSLGTALLQASEALNSGPDASRFAREIIVISDFQEGSRLEGLQGYEWPRGTEVLLEPIQPPAAGNARADWIAGDANPRAEGTAETIRVRVTNEPGSRAERFQLLWASKVGEPGTATEVPAGQARVFTLPAPTAAGDKLLLTGDETAFDNETFVAPLQPEQTVVLFAGMDAPNDGQKSLYFLQRAFPATRREKVDIHVLSGEAAIPPWELAQAQMLVLGEGIGEDLLASARTFAESGKIVLLPLTSSGSAKVFGSLVGQPALTAEEATVRNYAILAQIDFQHPLFAPFADPRYSDFSKIHFWKYRRLLTEQIPGAKVLARFDSNDPAVVQVPLGRGSVVALASSWRPADSQLALSTKFVPLLYALLGQSSGRPARQEQYSVGDAIPLPPAPQPWIIKAPSGATTEVAPGASFAATTEPGLHTVNPGAITWAINLAPEESHTNALPPDRLTALGVPAHGANLPDRAATPEAAAQAQRIDSEARQKLWRWLLAAAVAILLLETTIAGALTRRPVPAN